MVRRRSGHIVAISSVQGRIAIPHRSACKLFLLINPSVSVCSARAVDRLSVRLGQMQHLNTPPRPTSTVFEPSLSTAGSVWAWSVLGTSGPTCRSTPSQETAPSTEVRPPRCFANTIGGYFCKQLQIYCINITSSHSSPRVVSFGQEYGAGSWPHRRGPGGSRGCPSKEQRCHFGRTFALVGHLPAHSVARSLLQTHGFSGSQGTKTKRWVTHATELQKGKTNCFRWSVWEKSNAFFSFFVVFVTSWTIAFWKEEKLNHNFL